MNTTTIRSSLVSALLMAATTCAPADTPARYTDTPVKAYHRTVSLRGLDLSSPRDVKRLHGRLYRAARAACDGQRSYPRDYITEVLRPCMKDAMDRAVAQIHSPVLTAFHVQKSQDLRLSRTDGSYTSQSGR